jgi:protein-S-isoprenylcysteine O-methyltransferase Ste14
VSGRLLQSGTRESAANRLKRRRSCRDRRSRLLIGVFDPAVVPNLGDAMMLLRHLAAILLLPFVVVAVVPCWLLASQSQTEALRVARSPMAAGGRMLGGLLLLAGLSVFLWCVLLFARVGRGTLAPWDPTQRLVVVGPYRHVRNPMITSVATMLAAEALVTGSQGVAIWLVVFALWNHLHFVFIEEPGLERRFGASYDEYKAAVPRWLPRIEPWKGAR